MSARQKWIAAAVLLAVGWFVCGYIRARAEYELEGPAAVQAGVRLGPQ